MRTLMTVVVLLVVGIAAFGYYRGWFALSTNSTDKMPSATITVDKDKFNADKRITSDKVQGVEHKVKQEIGDLTAKPKDSQHQP